MPVEIQIQAPARATVNLAAIRHNVCLLKAAAADLGSRIMAVIKADAYGHGAVRVAQTMVACGVEAFAVATVVEAVELRCGGVSTAKVLVLGAPLPGDLPIMEKYNLDVMISSLEVATRVQRKVASLPGSGALSVHLYVETGMTRLGLKPDEIHQALEILFHTRRVKISGVCTHFAEADDAESHFLEQQLQEFDAALSVISKHQISEGEVAVHISNSAALLDARFHELLRKYKASYVRPGVALYGFYPQVAHRRNEHTLGEMVAESKNTQRRVWVRDLGIHSAIVGQLEEVMTFQAKITHIMHVEQGTTVGYSRTWVAPEQCLIATLGVGYADGYPRAGSRKAQVSIRGRYYPIAGNICMDMCMVNLGISTGPGQEVQVGDDAVLFGPGGITASELAFHCDTIHWEILTGVQKRVYREYVDDENGVRELRRTNTTPRGQMVASLFHEDQDAH